MPYSHLLIVPKGSEGPAVTFIPNHCTYLSHPLSSANYYALTETMSLSSPADRLIVHAVRSNRCSTAAGLCMTRRPRVTVLTNWTTDQPLTNHGASQWVNIITGSLFGSNRSSMAGSSKVHGPMVSRNRLIFYSSQSETCCISPFSQSATQVSLVII